MARFRRCSGAADLAGFDVAPVTSLADALALAEACEGGSSSGTEEAAWEVDGAAGR